ncbi:MAG: DNA polymerase domain-containing protein [Actinobacteria bacterium]|nr:DNA polymerase domain-containing protein [Actinomycetota bacterium]
MGSGAEVAVGGRTVRISSPEKIWFPAIGATKLEVVEYFLAVADGALRAIAERPTVLHRFPDGVEGEGFFQKRVGRAAAWIETVPVTFPAGGHADELCPTEPAHVLWAVNLGCLEFHPWQVRRNDLLRPDELRLDLDPQPGVAWGTVRAVARVAQEVLADVGLQGFPKTSGGRGLHVYARIESRWGYLPVRRAVLALAREIERRAPELATAEWWKQDRGERVFIDFNQNLPDKTVTSAYSIRPGPRAQVSCPITWDELETAEPADFTIRTVPGRLVAQGDLMAALDEHASSLEPALEWVARDERTGLGEAPFPPHFPKMPGEPPRVHPSRARRSE